MRRRRRLHHIDTQHKTLFATSEQFRETLDAGEGSKTYDLFLEFLTTYAEVHFDIEEGCMLAFKCPVAAKNKHEHGLFLMLIEKESARFAEHGFDRAAAEATLDLIDKWLDSHICRIDVQLRDAAR